MLFFYFLASQLIVFLVNYFYWDLIKCFLLNVSFKLERKITQQNILLKINAIVNFVYNISIKVYLRVDVGISRISRITAFYLEFLLVKVQHQVNQM
jgi:hypothetical protein